MSQLPEKSRYEQVEDEIAYLEGEIEEWYIMPEESRSELTLRSYRRDLDEMLNYRARLDEVYDD